MPKVFIIILNWNGWRDTIECLKSLSGLDYDNFEIIVVDNASTDDSVPKLKDYFKNYIHHYSLLTAHSNLGFAGGNNIGIREALNRGADYILLLNNDTVVDRKFLKELVRIGESDKKIGILGPVIYFFDEPERIWFAGGRVNWLKTKGEHLGYNKRVESYSSSDPALSRTSKKGRGNREVMFSTSSNNKIVDYISGCCLLIKKEVIEQIGLMDEDYFLYYEDTDWCLRAQKSGYRCVPVPSAKIYHKISQSVAKLPSFYYIYYHTRNGLRMGWRLGNYLTRTVLVGWMGWLLAKQIIKLIIGYKREWARAVIAGVGDFLRGKFGKI